MRAGVGVAEAADLKSLCMQSLRSCSEVSASWTEAKMSQGARSWNEHGREMPDIGKSKGICLVLLSIDHFSSRIQKLRMTGTIKTSIRTDPKGCESRGLHKQASQHCNAH